MRSGAPESPEKDVLATADECDNFDLRPRVKVLFVVRFTGYNVLIHFHGYLLGIEIHLFQQVGNGVHVFDVS